MLLKFLVADWTFMLAIYNLKDAVFAESVATLGDIGVIVGLKADYALCKLADYFIDTDLYLLVVL